MTLAQEITERLGQIRKRCAEATPGPWEFGETEGMDRTWMIVTAVPTDDDILFGETRPRANIVRPEYRHIEAHGKQQAIADLELTAHAREDIPWLLKQLELMRDLAMQRSIMHAEAVQRNQIAVEGLKGGAGRIAELEAKLAEAQKDSARLDWLKGHSHITLRIDDPRVRYGIREELFYPAQDLRVAIDAAMGGAK